MVVPLLGRSSSKSNGIPGQGQGLQTAGLAVAAPNDINMVWEGWMWSRNGCDSQGMRSPDRENREAEKEVLPYFQ